jgi:hypothetical protein
VQAWWNESVKVLSDFHFLDKLREYNKDSMTPEMAKQVHHHFCIRAPGLLNPFSHIVYMAILALTCCHHITCLIKRSNHYRNFLQFGTLLIFRWPPLFHIPPLTQQLWWGHQCRLLHSVNGSELWTCIKRLKRSAYFARQYDEPDAQPPSHFIDDTKCCNRPTQCCSI